MAPDGENEMADNTEVLISLSRMEGQLNTLLGVLDRHDADIRKVDAAQQSDKTEIVARQQSDKSELTDAIHKLDTRMTAIESAKKSAIPWPTIISALASIGSVITVVLVLLDGRYS